MKKDPTLQDVARWHHNSCQVIDRYHQVWQENIRLIRGIPLVGNRTFSNVMEEPFIYYRKTWSSLERVKADLTSTFLLEQDKFKIQGIGSHSAYEKARVLENATKIRFREMCRKDKLNMLFMWAFDDLLNFSFCGGKLWWAYNEEAGENRPRFVLYPPEQIKPDFSSEGIGTISEMKYIILESYLTKEDMKIMGFKNIDNIRPCIDSNLVRDARYIDYRNPIHNRDGVAGYSGFPQGDAAYRYSDRADLYKVCECYYKTAHGDIYWCTTDTSFNYFLKKPQPWITPFYPIILGSMITEGHRLIGDSFPQVIKAPQEFHNFLINKRRENISQAINKRYLLPRNSGLDMEQFLDNENGGFMECDFPEQVIEFKATDITNDAYMETQEAEREIADITGSTAVKQGNIGSGMKATTAKIALSESNAKQNMYSFAISETFFSDFFYKLSWIISRFETNQEIIEVAHAQYVDDEDLIDDETYDLTDFEFETEITVSPTHMNRQEELQNITMAMDRAAQINQSTMQLIQMGVMPMEEAKFINTTELFTMMVKRLGGQLKDMERYLIQAQPPPPEMQGQQGQGPGVPSMARPQQQAANNNGQY